MVTSTTETDVTNNTATADADVTNPVLDLVLNKDDSVDPLAVGDNTVYTVTVNNSGPSAAEDVVVTDTLPGAGLSFQSVTSSAGSCPTQPAIGAVGGTIICNLGNIPAGTTRTITVTMTGVAKGVVTNNATVTSAETALGFENAANNSVNETTTIRTRADMEVVSKIPSATPVDLRQNFNFIVKVRNNTGVGLDEADGVVVSDTLPAGMELTGTPTIALVAGTTTLSSCTGAAGATSFTCNLGTVSSGGEVDITVPVQVVSVSSNGQLITNRASVLTTSLDIDGGSNPNGGNNFNDGDVTVNSSSIAGRVFRDFDNNGIFDGDDTGIAGISMTLTGTSFDGVAVNRVVVTDASGNYIISGLPEGIYTVTEGPVNDINLVDGIDTAGSVGGNTSVNDVISAINLPGNTDATGYLFAEIPIPRIGLAKSAGAVVDNGNGTYDVVFTLTVTNAGATPLVNVQVTDSIDVGGPLSLGTYTPNPVPAAGQYTIVGAPTIGTQTNGASLTPVAAGVYTGSGAGNGLLVPAASSLPSFTPGSHSTATILFTVRFFP
ncbi:MAG: SdrD B-like domain-containing protein, partial [Flavobacterium sp.]|nr:SdrD B-like domain-containing protein [Flavobacterium sp.]